MKTMTVTPAGDRLVRDPVTKMPLPAEGKTVPCTSYWLRRLAAGDVVEVAAPKKPAAKKPAASAGGEE